LQSSQTHAAEQPVAPPELMTERRDAEENPGAGARGRTGQLEAAIKAMDRLVSEPE